MNKYLLLMYDPTDTLEKMTPKQMQDLVQAHMKWADELAEKGHLQGGDGLEETGACITGKDSQVSEGPFLEAKQLLGGYYLIEAESLEKAVEIAKGCPCHQWGGTTEVRPVMDYAPPIV